MKYILILLITVTTIVSFVNAAYKITDSGVIFEYTDKNAQNVYVAGDFNNWNENSNKMERDTSGVFRTTIELKPGKHQYKFIVDGVWKEDLDNPNSVEDTYGGKNSLINVPKSEQSDMMQSEKKDSKEKGKAVFKYYNPDARAVYLAGEFNNWSPDDILMDNDDGEWTTSVDLPPGEYEYKFVVDGNWISDPLNPITKGDMGNSVIKINDDGTASYPNGEMRLSNTTSSSRILFSGLLVSKFITYRDKNMPGYVGDGRWKLYNPEMQVDVNLKIHIADGVSAFSSFDVNTFKSDTIYAAHLELDSAGISMHDETFDIDAAYNREFFSTGDPLGLIGTYSYDAPTFENPQMFGIGYAGISMNTKIQKTFLKDMDIKLLFANMFKDWSLQSDSFDFPNLFGRRQIGFWSKKIARSDEPDDFSDYGTDVFAGRISKNIYFIKPGFTFRIDRNRWWLPIDEISYDRMDTIINDYDLQSDWFDMGSMEMGFGGDLTSTLLSDNLTIWCEYLNWKYRSSIDAGNYANSDNTGDSTLNIELGKQSGYLTGGGISVNFLENLNTNISMEIEHYDPMDSLDVYILPNHNSGVNGRPTLTYENLKKYDRLKIGGTIGYDYKKLSMDIDYSIEKIKDNMTINEARTNILFNLLEDKLLIKGQGIYSFGKLDVSDIELSGIDFILNAKYCFWNNFAMEGDLYLKSITYKYPKDFVTDTTDSGYAPSNIDNVYIAPYMAFLYEPHKNVDLELSFGIRPYNLQGKYTGRTEWVYNTMEDNSISYLDVLKRMNLYQAMNIVATIKF